MSDPFGALATQRIGDVGVHIGQGSWAGSSQQSNVTATFGTGTPDSALVPVNASITQINDGTATKPQTKYQPSFRVSRIENISTTTHANYPMYAAAIAGHVESLTGNKNQPVAVCGFTYGYAENNAFVLGGYFQGDHKAGTGGGGMGVTAQGSTTVVGSAAQSFAGVVQNLTGANQAYAASGNTMTGVDLYYLNSADGSGSNYAGAAAQARAIGGSIQWDVGYAVLTGSTRTAAFRDDSSAAYGLYMSGDHASAGIYIEQNNASHYAQQWHRTSATAALWGLILDAGGNLSIDEPGVAQKLYLVKGTPGANLTDIYLQEGAGPTLRRMHTFDPGVGGFNFVGGELVCILV